MLVPVETNGEPPIDNIEKLITACTKIDRKGET